MASNSAPKPKPQQAQAKAQTQAQASDKDFEPKDVPAPEHHSLRYVGSADRRVMTVQDMEALGVDSPADLVWSRDNNFTVSSPALSKESFEALMAIDGFDIA